MWISISAASKRSLSRSSRAAAMLGAGPTTLQPRSASRSAVNGPTTGESSTIRMRRPLRPVSSSAFLRGLVDKAGNDIAIASRHFHLRAGIEHQETFAVGVRLHLPDQVEIDDGRAVHALETPRVE